MGRQPLLQGRQLRYRHVKHTGLTGSSQGFEVQAIHAALTVTGGKHDLMGQFSVGQWNAGVGAATGRRGDTRYHLECNIRLPQGH